MRYIFIVLTLLIACSVKETKEQSLFQKSPDTQSFMIASNMDTTIVGNQGTKLKFKANSFIDKDGNNATGEIKIELAEFYKIPDFILNNLSTNTTNGMILKSSGMIDIKASQNGKDLTLKENSPMTIFFKKVQNSTSTNLFYGTTGKHNEIIWDQLKPVYDTIVLRREIITQKRFNQKIIEVNIIFIIGSDTIPLTESNKNDFKNILAQVEKLSQNSLINNYRDSTLEVGNSSLNNQTAEDNIEALDYKQSNPYYFFKTTRLGYLNCDIPIDPSLYKDLRIQSNQEYPVIIIILNGANAAIYPTTTSSDGKTFLFKVPNSYDVTIVAYKTENNQHYYCIKSLNELTDTSIELKKESLEKIRNAIKQLD